VGRAGTSPAAQSGNASSGTGGAAALGGAVQAGVAAMAGSGAGGAPGPTGGKGMAGAAGGGALSAGASGSMALPTGGANAGAGSTTAGTGCGVPTSFKWTSSTALISPRSGAVSIKDPSIVFFNDKWHLLATEYTTNYNMVYLSFTDWNAANSATKTSASTNPNLTGYKCAPTMFYFSPQKLWYIVYQTQTPAYSTASDPGDVKSWSAKKDFWSSHPSIITGSSTGGIDYWPICDQTNCYIFYSADNGELYRAQTTKASFPNGFGNHTKVMGSTSNKNALFEASNVYKIKGAEKYLLIVEAIGNGRYFRSWTADKLDGTWTPLADTEAKPFAGTSNVTGAAWSNDGISHGEMLRDGYDETMVIDTCNLQYLFQGRTAAGSSYNLNEYSLGLLTAAK
jgi:endo-1,4-beta-xylanase